MDSRPNCRYNYLMQYLEADKLIKASALFRNLHPDETANILARLQPATFESGTCILESGVWHGLLYIIASGTVSVFLQEDTSNGARIAQLGPGECFGEMSLITGEPPSATVRADEDITVWALPEEDFLTLIRTCPTLLQNINAILSRRLARTNRQILSQVAAEKIWISLVYNPEVLLERSLIVHITDALATCSRKRVLMLESCGQDQAIGPHFATLTNQLRPALLDCVQDHSLLHAHRIPTRTTEGQYYAAFAAFAATSEQMSTLDASALTTTPIDLAGHYDYLLLVTTQATPHNMVQTIAEQCARTIVIVSANSVQNVVAGLAPARPDAVSATSIQNVETELAPFMFSSTSSSKTSTAPSFFVAHVPEHPTIGVQDRYTARLGHTITRLVPADFALLEQCWDQQARLQQLARAAELTKAVDFVARHSAHQTAGMALGGGGARGFAHL